MNKAVIIGRINGETTHEVVSGYKLPNGFFAHKAENGWTLSDYASGLKVKDGLRSLADAKAAAVDADIRSNVESMKYPSSPHYARYNKACTLRNKYYKEDILGM